MAFDIQGARQAGYSDGEIAAFLGQQSGFDVEAATKAGYAPAEIVGFLAEKAVDRGPATTDDPLTRVTPSTPGGTQPTFTTKGGAAVPGLLSPDDTSANSVLDNAAPADASNVRTRRSDFEDRQYRQSVKAGKPGKEPLSASIGANLDDAPMPVRAIVKASSGAAQGAFGLIRAGADLVGADTLADVATGAGASGRAFDAGMGDARPIKGFGPKSPLPYLKDMSEGAASSLIQSAVAAGTLGAGAVIPAMSLMTAGQEYDKARQAGLDPMAALAGAIPKGIFEAIGEKFTGLDKVASAMGTLLQRGATAQAKRSAGEVLLHAGIREVPGEVLTYLGQSATDILPGIGLNQGMTMRDFVEGLRDTVVQSSMMGAAVGGGGALVRSGTPEPKPVPSATDLIRTHWGDQFIDGPTRVNPDPVSSIMSAPTVDDAIAAAQSALSTQTPASADAVTNIERILGTEPSNVSNPLAVTPELGGSLPAGSDISIGGEPDRGLRNDGPAGPVLDPAAGIEQGGQPTVAVGGPASGAYPVVPVATMSDAGTLHIEGDPNILRQFLAEQGITATIPTRTGLIVGRDQSAQAQAIMQQFQPAFNASIPEAPGPSMPNTRASAAPPAQTVAAPIAQASALPAAQAEIPANPTARYGVDGTDLAEGGKPFKTRDQAKASRKLQPMMRVIKVQGGFALTEKTAAQLAAEEAAAKRLRNPKTTPAGDPISAHAFIAGEGGLSKDAMADAGFDRNQRIGNRYLFARQGSGMTAEEATQRLIEWGYLPETASINDAMALIKKSATSSPQYTPEGWERIAAAEQQTRFEDHLTAQGEVATEEDPFGPEPAFTTEEISLVPKSARKDYAALMEAAEAEGIDVEAILEQAARMGENWTQEQYDEYVHQTLESAIAGSRRQVDLQQGAVEGREDAQRGGPEGRGEDAGGQGDAQGAESEGLTAPTRADVLAQDKQREEESQRQKDGGDKPIEKKVTADTPDMFNTQGSVFDAPEEPTEPTEITHNGTRIYQTKIAGRDGAAPSNRWAVESPSNKQNREAGDRNRGGDSLHETLEAAKESADFEAKKHAQDQARKSELETREQSDRDAAQAKKDANAGKSLTEIKAQKYMAQEIKDGATGDVITRSEWVKRIIDAGSKPSIEMVDKIKPMSRMATFRASNEEQRAHDKRVKEGGKIPEYSIGNYVVSKTEYDYAQKLIAQEPAAPTEVTPAKPASEMSAAELLRAAADKMEAAEKAAAPATKLEAEQALWKRINAGTATLDEFKAGFEAWVSDKPAIVAEMLTKKKDDLLRMGGPYFTQRYKSETKPDIADALWRDGLGTYSLGKSVTYGMGKDSYQNAVRRQVEATDDTELEQHVKDIEAAKQERAQRSENMAKAIENPQTLGDYENLIRAKASEAGVKTMREAMPLLTPEQRAEYDRLAAAKSREARKGQKEEQQSVRVAGQQVDGQIIETKHTQKGYDLFVVQLAERVSREDYETLSTSAKRMGGHYSSFRGRGAVPGFQFKDRATADAFVKLANGDSAEAQQAVDARRDAYADDRSQTAVERLTEMADKMQAAAEESLGRERKANTERRARFAAAAEAAASADKAMAKTMRNIAEAIKGGNADMLASVRTKSQVEMLTSMVKTAKDAELRAKYPTYAEQEKRKGEPATADTASYAEFPTFTAFRSDLASLARQLMEVDGTKKIGAQLMKVADDVSDAYLKFAKDNLGKVSQFMRGGDMAVFASREDAERAIKRSGLTGKAIVLPVKRGENRIILSPSEAIERKVWTGDDDKRITLTKDFGQELVQTIGRRANKTNKLTTPWQFETASDRLKALARLGIETAPEFRTALREFIGLQERAQEADRVKMLERAMVGRKKDGLDFFPTPQTVADEMVETADIKPDMAVLEPSAGMGHIADRIRAAGAEPDVIEMSGERRELLEAKGFTVAGSDFMELQPRAFYTFGDVFRAPDGTEGVMRGGNSLGRVRLVGDDGEMVGAGFYNREDLTGIRHSGTGSGYDRIVMNPPFSDRRDAEHVQHAYTLLKPGGRLVAIMGEGVFFGQDKKAEDFRAWLEKVGGTDEKLAEGTFMDPTLPVNTGVNARMVVIDKPSDDKAPMFSRAQPFYSALSKSIEGMTPKALPGAIWKDGIKGLINKGAVKEDEVEWSGIREWLDLQTGKVSKDAVLAYLDGNGVQVQEVVLGGTEPKTITSDEALERLRNNMAVGWRRGDQVVQMYSPESIVDDGSYYRELVDNGDAEWIDTGTNVGGEVTNTKYGNYTLPGGENYREVLLTLPDKTLAGDPRSLDTIAREMYGRRMNDLSPTDQAGVRAKTKDDASANYKSSHWDQPNVLAHIRLNDRTDADGKRVLFVEEIQSDWGQDGKKRGFTSPADEANFKKLSERYYAAESERRALLDRAKELPDATDEFVQAVDRASELNKEMVALTDQMNALYDKKTQGIPVAPFVTATDKWLTLALKRVITMAAQEGYDRVAFVNGEQSAERYDLSKQVRSIAWTGRGNDTEKRVTITPNSGNDIEFRVLPDGTTASSSGGLAGNEFASKRLDEVVGKDVAERIMGTPYGDMRGNGLKVGGEGMMTFYDKIVPAAANKLLAKLGGGKVEVVKLPGEGAFDKFDGIENGAVVWTFDSRYAAEKWSQAAPGRKFRPASADGLTQPGFTITPAMREKASAGLPLFRKGADQTTGLTPTQFTQALAEAFGAKVADRLQAKGVVVPLADQTKLPAHVVPFLRDGDIVFGFYDPRTDRTYAVLENLTPGMVKGLALHEVGVHYGFEAMLGADKYKQVMKQLDLMRRSGNVAVQKAHAEAVANAARPSQIPEETLAYLVQEAPNNSVIKDVIARIKAWLFREFGIGGKYLTTDDLTALARAAVQHAARTEPGGVEVPAFMRASDDPVAASAVAAEQVAAFRSQYPATPPSGMSMDTARTWLRDRRAALDALVQELAPMADGMALPVRNGGTWLVSREARPDGSEWRITRFDKNMVPQGHEAHRAAADAVADLVTSVDVSRLNKWNPAFMRAYHGTPHSFDKFSTDKIGTGEGAQAYGWGLYFAGKKEIAQHYRSALVQRDPQRLTLDGKRVDPNSMLGRAIEDMAKIGKDAVLQKVDDNIKFNATYAPAVAESYRAVRKQVEGLSPERVSVKDGNLYEVEIPEEGEYLLWDKPLNEQPEKVRKAILNGGRFGDGLRMAIGNVLKKESYTGQDIYKSLERQLGSDRNASDRMFNLGIKGIKYLDGTSRADGDGTYNYVIFSADDVAIQNQPAFMRQNEGMANPGKNGASAEELDDALDALVRNDLEDDQVFTKPLPKADDDSLTYVTKLGGYKGIHVSVRGGALTDTGPREVFFHNDDDEPIGFARLTKNDKRATISMIAFNEDARGNGYAKAFYRYLLDEIGVAVRSDSEITEGTAALYRSLLRDYSGKVDADGRVTILPNTGAPQFSRTPQTETKAFKDWFGDSKVVDDEGKPLVVYHGTKADFDVFKRTSGGEFGPAIYLTDNPREAGEYGDGKGWGGPNGTRIMPLYVSIKNPYTKGVDAFWKEFGGADSDAAALDRAQAAGYDGIIAKRPDRYYDNEAREFVDRGGELTHYIAFRPEQIKSAHGNNGEFDPANPDIRYARGGPDEESGPTPSAWRDSTGRMQFAPGQWLYDKIGEKAGPMLNMLGLKAASPELRRQLRQMKLDVQKAQDTAVAVAKETAKLSDEERKMVSDIIEQELRAGVVPPAHAVKLAGLINDTMERQTDELVELGMLTKDSADRWRGKYLPRYYENKLGKKVGEAWADAVRRITGHQSAMKGIKGKHLKGRGIYETIPTDQLKDWQALGWEVRDPDYQPGFAGIEDTVQVWRDFTREERDNMGEIRDSGFRFVMGYMESQRDIALGRMFDRMAKDPASSSRLEKEGYVQVPNTIIEGTGAKRYGNLAGRWVPMETMSQLSNIEESQSAAWQMYRKALGLWKESKTVLNPVSHVNNIVSNLTMAHLAGVSYHRGDKYVAAARDFLKKTDMLKEAKENGLFLGTLSDAELMNSLPEELKILAQKQESTAEKVGRNAFNVMSMFLRKPMGAAYQAEDTFFRYLIYKDAREHGMEPQDAVDYAQKYIFTYDDLPKGARMIRDFPIGLPFFSYTYKAIPALLHTALVHPVRIAAPAAVLWAANAAAYAIAAGDDDDDWQDSLMKYITDPAYRDKVRSKEKMEREHLPPWMKGSTALMTPKAIRLGTDELTKLPVFIDVSRIIPGGDLFDVSPNAGGIPLPQPFTPSHPIFTTLMAMIGNKDPYFGKEIADSNDTRGEATQKRAAWLWKQISPAIAINNSHWERGMNALAQATGGEVTWLPDVLGGDATGIGHDGNPVQPKYAAMNTFGIKARPIDLDASESIDRTMREKIIRDIDAEIRKLVRYANKMAIPERTLESARELARIKKDRLREGLTVDGDEKN